VRTSNTEPAVAIPLVVLPNSLIVTGLLFAYFAPFSVLGSA